MGLIGLLLNLAAVTATVWANHEGLTLSLSERTLVRYTNESLIVQCNSSTPDVRLHWRSPKGEKVTEHRGRIHVEQSSPGELKLVFLHIALADKGKWTCEDINGGEHHSKSFDLIVYQKITFTENATIITVKEGSNATILCEVKGEPQPNVTWNFDGRPITIEANSTKYRILADGLLINRVTQNNTGEYACRAYQVNSIASDMQERRVLMKIAHKPIWPHKRHSNLTYAYINGSVTIVCEAVAEPPANFTWYRGKKQLQNNTIYTIKSTNTRTELTVQAHNSSVFKVYTCSASNQLGGIERSFKLEEGQKPPTPNVFKLRGLNSNRFDFEMSTVRSENPDDMHVIGYRIEFMTEHEFKEDGGKWLNTSSKDFGFEDGASFMLENLEPNTTYLLRASSRNAAGLSDWTKVERIRTLSNEPPTGSAHLGPFISVPLLCVSPLALLLSKELIYGFQATAGLMKLQRYRLV